MINGIHAAGSTCKLAHIAAGSGNDFARRHRLPATPVKTLEKILQAKEDEEDKAVDLLQANGRMAINSVGTGFDGAVAREANKAWYKKWLNQWKLGVLSYIITVIRVLFYYQPCTISLNIDGKEERLSNVWLIAAANIPNYGGGMLICPDADDQD